MKSPRKNKAELPANNAPTATLDEINDRLSSIRSAIISGEATATDETERLAQANTLLAGMQTCLWVLGLDIYELQDPIRGLVRGWTLQQYLTLWKTSRHAG